MNDTNWNSRVAALGGDFMQSVEWGAFHKKLGWRVERVEGGGVFAQIIFRPLPLGANEGYVPLGPLFVSSPSEADGEAFLRAVRVSGDKNTAFFEYDLFLPTPFLPAPTPHTRQPLSVCVVDIEGKDKEALYEVFHPTLRQNLERAERYTLEVKQEEGWERFYDLYTATMQRHKLRPWHKEYIKTLWETLVPLGVCEIWSVYYNGELLSSNLYILFNGRATHLFGGSSGAMREAMGPHFLHAHMMSVFAGRGMGKYDLGKVD